MISATFKSYLNKCFQIKDLNPLKCFLGIEVAHRDTGIFLSQRKYVLDILAEAASKPVEFPMEQNYGLAIADGPVISNPAKYQRLVGRLVYLTITRPDLCYVVHILSSFFRILSNLI